MKEPAKARAVEAILCPYFLVLFSTKTHNSDSKDCWLEMTWWNTWSDQSNSAKLRVWDRRKFKIARSSSSTDHFALRTKQCGEKGTIKKNKRPFMEPSSIMVQICIYVCKTNSRGGKHLCNLRHRWANLVFSNLLYLICLWGIWFWSLCRVLCEMTDERFIHTMAVLVIPPSTNSPLSWLLSALQMTFTYIQVCFLNVCRFHVHAVK